MSDKYIYRGPIMAFGRCVCDYWVGETWASTKWKAKNNLLYQAKKYCNLTSGGHVELPGTIKMVI